MLIELMKGVEDIPGPVLREGMDWEWETFNDFLYALDKRPHDMDICAQFPHAAVRVYVLGERAKRGKRPRTRTLNKCADLPEKEFGRGH